MMIAENPCYLFCGGGTGGHLTPGLALAEEIRLRQPHARVIFAGTGRNGEREWVLRHGFVFLRASSAPWGLGPLRTPRFFACNAAGLAGALALQMRVRPAAVVGLGGYAALPHGAVAGLTGRTLALLEQNAVPGKTNRQLSRWAREVFCAWGDAREGLRHPERAFVTGNPIRKSLRQPVEPETAVRRFGLDPKKRTLLVMGGSQGAAAVNMAVIGALPLLADCTDWLQVLHLAGHVTFERVREAYQTSGLRHCVKPFTEDMAFAYAAADFVVCRAGGTSLAEISAAGLPSALVPLPIAAEDHQTANARIFERAGAALLVPQTELTPESVAELVRSVLGDDRRRTEMAAASRMLGRPLAAEAAADRLLAAVEEAALQKSGDEGQSPKEQGLNVD